MGDDTEEEHCEGFYADNSTVGQCVCECTELHFAEGVETQIGYIFGIHFTVPIVVIKERIFACLNTERTRGVYDFCMFLSIPESGWLIITGLFLGLFLWLTTLDSVFTNSVYLSFNEDIFFLFLIPPIIFDAGYNLDVETFRGNFALIFFHAIVGTLTHFILLGTILYGLNAGIGLTDLSSLEIYIFSALISAVDPVSVLSIFKVAGVNERLNILVACESILNDAVSIVLYRMFVDMGSVDPHFSITAEVIGLSIIKFLYVSLFGCFVGILGGVLATLLTAFNRKLQHHECEIAHGHYHGITIVIGFSFLAYFIAESTYSSGIIAILFCGIVMNQYLKPLLCSPVRQSLDIGLHVFGQLCESLVFLYLGIDLVIYSHHFNWGLILISNVLILSLRMVIVFTISYCFNFTMFFSRRRKFIPAGDIFIHAFSGIRGAIAFALAFMIPHIYYEEEHIDEIVTASFSVILFTIFFQGTLNGSLIGIMGIRKKKKSISEFLEDLQKMLKYLTKMSIFLPPYQTTIVEAEEEERVDIGGKGETFIILDGNRASHSTTTPLIPKKVEMEEESVEEGGGLCVSDILGEDVSSSSTSEEEEVNEKSQEKEHDQPPPGPVVIINKVTKILTGTVPSSHPVFHKLLLKDFLENYEKLRQILGEYPVNDDLYYAHSYMKKKQYQKELQKQQEKIFKKEEEVTTTDNHPQKKKRKPEENICHHHRWREELEECPCDDLLPTEDVRRKSLSLDLDESGRFYRLEDDEESEEGTLGFFASSPSTSTVPFESSKKKKKEEEEEEEGGESLSSSSSSSSSPSTTEHPSSSSSLSRRNCCIGEEEIVIESGTSTEEEEEEEMEKKSSSQQKRRRAFYITRPGFDSQDPTGLDKRQKRFLIEGIPPSQQQQQRSDDITDPPQTRMVRTMSCTNDSFFYNHKNVSNFLKEQSERNRNKNRSGTCGKYIVMSGGQKNLKLLILNLKKYVTFLPTHKMEELIMDKEIVSSQREIIQNYQRDLAFEIESLFVLEEDVLKDAVEKKQIHGEKRTWYENLFSKVFFIF